MPRDLIYAFCSVLTSFGRKWRLFHTGIVKLLITIVQDEDGMYIAECPAILGCVSQGKSEQEAKINIRGAIRKCLEVRVALGISLTVHDA